MTYTEQDLLDRGFVDTSFTDDEGNRFTEHTLTDFDLLIEVSGLSLFELGNFGHFITLNIQFLSELDTVIKVFGLNKK